MFKEVSGEEIFGKEQPTEIEASLAEFDKMIEQKKLLDELLASKAFQVIIVEGYLEDDYERLTGLLKNTSVNSRVVQERQIIVDKIVSKGYLENWLETLVKTTNGIDNPEHRIEFLKQLADLEAEKEAMNEEV